MQRSMHGFILSDMTEDDRFMAFFDLVSAEIKLSPVLAGFLAQASGIGRHRQWLLLRAPFGFMHEQNL